MCDADESEYNTRTVTADVETTADVDDSPKGLLGRGVFGLADQAIVSAGNFLTTLFIARRLPESTFGTFAILFQLLLVLNNLHDSLVNYPLSVRGAKTSAISFRTLLGAGLITTLLLAIVWSGAIVVGAVSTGTIALLPWMILAMVCWQTQELLRRSLMAQHRFDEPIYGDSISFLGQAAAVFVLVKPESDLRLVFVIMAVTSALAAAIQFIQTRPLAASVSEVRQFVATGWDLGRWLLLNNLLGMINIQLLYWIVGYWHGLTAAALLAAVSNVLGITHPTLIGLTRLIVPSVAKTAHHKDTRSAIRTGGKFAAIGAVVLLPVYAAIALFPQQILHLFFKDKYAAAATSLRLLVIVYLIDYVGRMSESILNGLEENRAASIANIASAILTLCVSIPLVYFYSVNGALIGGCFSVLARQVVGAYFLRKAYSAK